MMEWPRIIQGGMGAGVSNWVLARAVACRGQLGVVSGTGLDSILVRRLQDGDIGGHMRRAMARFPFPDFAECALARFFRSEGRAKGEPYKLIPLHQGRPDPEREKLLVLANFVEVSLAKEGHDGAVGLNLLMKIQEPTLPSLYGAMLAGATCVLMGAGIPREIPGALDRLAAHQPASLRYDVSGDRDGALLEFDPRALWGADGPALERPRFLAIIASHALATMLARKANGRVDGFVVEGPTAGGHNAPPRGKPALNERGEPVYGERDVVDLEVMRALGVPFWLAGGVGSPAGLAAAEEAGAAGIQVGTLFAFCQESGLHDDYRRAVIAAACAGRVDVLTDPRASPTGFPFKVVEADGLPTVNGERQRVCDLGYLREAYRREDGTVGHRCPSEPVDQYVKKGGALEDTVGRRCLCNALLANIGLPQERKDGSVERPLLTSGDDLKILGTFLAGRDHYSAADVLDYLAGAGREPSATV
jgi:NAD(P)H-dependent flavin oxidoreductase YrpB (nitropropane dioxygenase family)